MRRSRVAILSLLLLMSTIAVRGAAQATPELPSSKQEVSNALEALRDRYGLDAVKLESFLLQYAIEAGAVLTTSVGMDGVERIDDHGYLRIDFDTGIVYARPASGSHAAARIWSDIVEPTLRQFQSMQLAADGILLRVRFRRSEDDVEEALRQRRQDSLPIEVVSFRILCRDVVDSVRSGATSKQLLERSVVLVKDRPTSLPLDEITPAHRPSEVVTPVLPLG